MTAKEFLTSIGQSAENIDVEVALAELQRQMESGLAGECCSLAMIPTFLYEPAENTHPYCNKRIIIDAGGTNFRSALGHFNEAGKPVFEHVERTKMPASDRELSAKEFYGAIAANVSRLAEEGGDVGFCFSYPMEIGSDRDGVVYGFTKEIKAPEVVGTRVGERTLAALREYGAKERRIVLLNDTVATLLGGMAGAEKKYSGYIGYIYGTGTNLCYTERAENIRKIGAQGGRRMIVNTECGNFDGFPRGKCDELAIANTDNPATFRFEKMTSGRYLSVVMELCLREAEKSGLFKEARITPFELREVSEFLGGEGGRIAEMFPHEEERAFAESLLRALVERAAKMGAIVCAAAAKRCGEQGGLPVAVIAEGTTFDRLPAYKEQFAAYLGALLAPCGIAFEIVRGDDLNMVGTLLATLAE